MVEVTTHGQLYQYLHVDKIIVILVAQCIGVVLWYIDVK